MTVSHFLKVRCFCPRGVYCSVVLSLQVKSVKNVAAFFCSSRIRSNLMKWFSFSHLEQCRAELICKEHKWEVRSKVTSISTPIILEEPLNHPYEISLIEELYEVTAEMFWMYWSYNKKVETIVTGKPRSDRATLRV